MEEPMDDEIWDEHQWEEFLQEADKRSELYRQHIEAYLKANPPPEEDAPLDEREDFWDRLHAHVNEQIGLTDDLTDDQDCDEDFDFDADDDLETGEEWKSGLAEDFPDEQDHEELPIWQLADDFGMAAHEWVDSLPEDRRESAVVEFCTNALLVGAKIAGGHAMGYEMDVLGGNIALAKRALAAANRALEALQYFRDSDLITEADYRYLYELGFEVRNAVGLYVQELRERFQRGVE